MLDMGVPVGAGTDATRVSSYNPWTSLYWLVSGKTVGGMALYPQGLSRETALQLFTQGSAWFSSEQGKKGQIKVGQLADLAALSLDFFSVDEEAIKGIESVLTIVDGKVVYGAAEFDKLGPPQVPVLPEWSPVTKVPGIGGWVHRPWRRWHINVSGRAAYMRTAMRKRVIRPCR